MDINNSPGEIDCDNLAADLLITADFPTASMQEVVERFGLFPNLFRPMPGVTGMMKECWSFTKSAYLDNPLPSLFKERLFIHLSGFCNSHYPLVRHAGFLIGMGRPAGDAQVTPQTVDELRRLLNRPLPNALLLTEAVLRIETMANGIAVPSPGTIAENDFFDALTVLFVEPARSNRIRTALRAALGEPAFEYTMSLMAYIRTEHYWVETHPNIAIEPDMIILMEADKELANLLLRPARLHGTPGEERLSHALSKIIDTMEKVSPMEMSNDTFQAALSEFRKIENAEKTLLQSEERFNILINAIPQVIWGNNAQGQANYFNQRWYDFSGLTFDESAGLGWQAIVHPDDARASIRRWQKAMQKHEQFETEYRLRRADGVYRWFIGRNVPLLDAENHVLGGSVPPLTSKVSKMQRLYCGKTKNSCE